MAAFLFQAEPLAVFGQAIVNGLAFGSIYALAALSLVLVFKVSELINFAYGELAMFSAFLAWTFIARLGWPYWWGVLAALGCAAGLGAGLERLLIRPLQRASPLSQVIVTIGLGTFLTGVAGWVWSFDSRPFPEAVSGPPVEAVGLIFRLSDLLRLGVAVVVAGLLFVFFRFTVPGLALRAMSENPGAARLMGIPVGRLTTLTWAIATMLAAVAGILIAPTTFLEPLMMADVALKAFAAAVLGGFSSLPGAVLGGLVLGVSDNLVGTYLNQELRNTFAFGLILIVLLARPQGLLGRTRKKKV